MKIALKYKWILLIILFVTTLIIFSNQNTYQNIFKTVNEKRLENKNAEIDQIDLSQYTFDENDKYNLGISEDQLKYLNFRYSITPSGEIKYRETNINTETIELTKEEAISDINFLFNALKYSYAGYIYFGGDEIWSNAKNKIIDSINSYEDKITSKDLEKILFNNLNFIQDGHFSINFNSPLQKSNFYYSEEFEVKEDEQGYYINYSNDKWYIKSINNDSNVQDYIKLSLNKNGELCNYIGVLNKANYFGRIKVVLSSANQEQIIYVKLTKSNGISHLDQISGYNYEEINGIPIFTMKRMYNFDSNDNSVELFAESANKAKNEDIVIIDIRGNIGGSFGAPFGWFKFFTRKNPEIKEYHFVLASLINNFLMKTAFKEIIELEVPLTTLIGNKSYDLRQILNGNENKWYIEIPENKENILIKNDTKIFVLVDNNTGSSGETFVKLLKDIENVIFVGTNTAGVFISESNIECILPNSKITIIYGSNLRLHNDIIEGVGFEPDIWINSHDSLDRILKFIN